MDDIMDRADDENYVGSLKALKPTCQWVFPDKGQIDSFTNSNPGVKKFEQVVASQIGCYLFGRWASELGVPKKEYVRVLCLFLDECATLRVSGSNEKKMVLVQRVLDQLFSAGGSAANKISSDNDALEIKWTSRVSADNSSKGVISSQNGNPMAYDLNHGSFSGVKAKSDSALGSKSIPDNLFEPIEEIVMAHLQNEHFNDFKTSQHYKKYLKFQAWFKLHTVDENDFEIFRVLGRGGFGLVNGCRFTRTGKMYAMKTMDKRRVKLNKGAKMCILEKELMSVCKSKFVLDLKYSFTNDFELFLIMDVKAGGDLNYHISHRKRFSEDEIKFYTIRIAEGLQAIHDCGWVYRDLKPENLLLDFDGRCSISDLGLACKYEKGLTGIAGTPGYWAPEVISGKDYDYRVDSWALGACIFEFFTGTCPFRSKHALKFGIKKGINDQLRACNAATLEMEFPFKNKVEGVVPAEALELCKTLLDRDPKKRGGPDDLGVSAFIKSHPYFADFDWEGVVEETFDPPFKPDESVNAADQDTIGKFKNESEVRKVDLDSSDNKQYVDFPYDSVEAFENEVVAFLRFENEQGRPLTASKDTKSSACTIS